MMRRRRRIALAVMAVTCSLLLSVLGMTYATSASAFYHPPRMNLEQLTNGGRDVEDMILEAFQHDGMVILPCSSNTLNSIAAGLTGTLIQRAAAVCLKERRKLVIAHRESPLSPIDIESMSKLNRAGAIIAPLSPGFYMLPKTLDDLVDFMVGRLMDQLGYDHKLPVRWKGSADKQDVNPTVWASSIRRMMVPAGGSTRRTWSPSTNSL